MTSQYKPSRDQILRDLITKTPVSYQKRLALAHHLKHVGKNPNLSSRFGPLEREAGELLAKLKFPLGPELEFKMRAGEYDPVKLLNTATPTTKPFEPAFDEQECDELSMSAEEEEAMWVGWESLRESFPHMIPKRPEKTAALSPTAKSHVAAKSLSMSAGVPEEPKCSDLPERALIPSFDSEERKSSPPPAICSAASQRRRFVLIFGMLAVGLAAVVTFLFQERSYVGTLSDIKGSSSGVIMDLDGKYPFQKMSVWVTRTACLQIQDHWPKVGARLKVIGKRSIFHGRPEIIVTDQAQLNLL